MELIIVDDGSNDNSIEVLKNFSDLEYLKVVKLDVNVGFCNALNEGIKVANGKYILRIDPDDLINPDRIEKQVNFLESNSSIDVVGSNVIYFSTETKNDIISSNFPLKHEAIVKEFLSGELGIQHPSSMIRASVMKKFRYNQENVLAEDYEIFASMIQAGHRFANIAEPLTRMRIHDNSVSTNIRIETIRLTYQIRDRIFGTKTHPFRIWTYFKYIQNYRKFLITRNKLLKLWFLLSAAMFFPSKIIRRIFKSK